MQLELLEQLLLQLNLHQFFLSLAPEPGVQGLESIVYRYEVAVEVLGVTA